MSASKRLSEDNSSPSRQEKPPCSIVPPSCTFLVSPREVEDLHHRSEVSFFPPQRRPEIGDSRRGLVVKFSPFQHGRPPHSTASTSPSQILLPKLSEAGNSYHDLSHGSEISSSPSRLPTLLPRPSEVVNSRYIYVFLPPRRRISRLVTQNIVHRASLPINPKQILINTFNQRKDAASAFPPKITVSTTRSAVK